MKWYIIDDATTDRGQVFPVEITADTQEEAILMARCRFKTLSKRDQSKRDAYYVGRAELDEDGCIDYDTMVDVYDIKGEKMRTYKIKPEYADLWGEDVDEDTVITEEELEMITRGWETTPEDVMDQLIPQED